jgi:hypothetical protein
VLQFAKEAFTCEASGGLPLSIIQLLLVTVYEDSDPM